MLYYTLKTTMVILTMKILLTLLVISTVGCTIRDETLSIADDLVTVKLRENKPPKVTVATGIDECRWKGKYQISGDYDLGINCEYKF